MIRANVLTKSLILVILLLLASPLFSQSLELVKGNKSRSIKTGSYLLVSFSEDHQNDDEECDYCLHTDVTGTLVEVTASAIVLDVHEFTEYKKEEDFDLRTNVHYEEGVKQLEISLAEIFYIEVNKSEKASNRRESIAIIGGIGFFMGVINILIGIILSGEGEDRTFLFVGFIEFCLGLLLLPFGYQRKYKLHKNIDDPWSILGI